MSKLGFIKNYFSSLVFLALKLTPILVITFLILSVQNQTMKLTIDHTRYPKIQTLKLAIPTVQKRASPNSTTNDLKYSGQKPISPTSPYATPLAYGTSYIRQEQ
jgi:hypothetical protein